MTMGRFIIPLALTGLLLAACEERTPAPDEADAIAAEESAGSYTVDPETGEVRATHTDPSGVTTTLAAGESVAPVLTPPFVLPPGASVDSVTRVERGEGSLVTIAFASELGVADLAQFYRDLAERGGFDLSTDLATGAGLVMAGSEIASETRFSLSIQESEEGSRAELTVSRGIG